MLTFSFKTLKGVGEVPFAPALPAGDHGLLIGVVLEDSETVEGTPERAPFVVALPLPEPLPFGVCANRETIFGVCANRDAGNRVLEGANLQRSRRCRWKLGAK